MLRVKPPWSASVRLLEERDRGAVLAICDRDPVTNVFVSSRVRSLGLEPARLGAQMWGHGPGGRLESLCYSGANLVPVCRRPRRRARLRGPAPRKAGRRCSSVVGPRRGPPRCCGDCSRPTGDRPVTSARCSRSWSPNGPLGRLAPDPLVRRIRPRRDRCRHGPPAWPCSPRRSVSRLPSGRRLLYRPASPKLMRCGRCLRPHRGRPGHLQGRDRRGHFAGVPDAGCVGTARVARPVALAEPGMAASWSSTRSPIVPVVSLCTSTTSTAAARAAYRRVGFTEIDRLMSVLF